MLKLRDELVFFSTLLIKTWKKKLLSVLQNTKHFFHEQMIHIQVGTGDFRGSYNRQNLSSHAPSDLEVNGKILNDISEEKMRPTASLFENCILQNPHYVTVPYRNGTQ